MKKVWKCIPNEAITLNLILMWIPCEYLSNLIQTFQILPVCQADSLKHCPHLQERVVWEEGTGVSIRPHTQQQQVKHREVIIWEGLYVFQSSKKKIYKILMPEEICLCDFKS